MIIHFSLCNWIIGFPKPMEIQGFYFLQWRLLWDTLGGATNVTFVSNVCHVSSSGIGDNQRAQKHQESMVEHLIIQDG